MNVLEYPNLATHSVELRPSYLAALTLHTPVVVSLTLTQAWQ